MIFVWEVLTVDGNELRLFMGQGIPPYCLVGTIFNVFNYDAVSALDLNLPGHKRKRYVLSHDRGLR